MAEIVKSVTVTYTLTLTKSEAEVIKALLDGVVLSSDQLRISDELLQTFERVMD